MADLPPPATTPSDTPDQVVQAASLAFQSFNIPGFPGDTRAALANMDVSKAPFIALLDMAPGAVLKRHWHQRSLEAVYVVSGTMINGGERLEAGSFLVHGPGTWHGPHATDEGCRLMFIQYPGVGPEDSVFDED